MIQICKCATLFTAKIKMIYCILTANEGLTLDDKLSDASLSEGNVKRFSIYSNTVFLFKFKVFNICMCMMIDILGLTLNVYEYIKGWMPPRGGTVCWGQRGVLRLANVTKVSVREPIVSNHAIENHDCWYCVNSHIL